jgi:hypothetical protein
MPPHAEVLRHASMLTHLPFGPMNFRSRIKPSNDRRPPLISRLPPWSLIRNDGVVKFVSIRNIRGQRKKRKPVIHEYYILSQGLISWWLRPGFGYDSVQPPDSAPSAFADLRRLFPAGFTPTSHELSATSQRNVIIIFPKCLRISLREISPLRGI